MDFLGPISPLSKSGALYVLLVVDYMSRFVMSKATARADA